MKKSLKKLPALLLTLLLALSLAACGGADDDDDTDLTDFIPMTVEELTGGWVDDDGNQLVIDPDTGTYDYRTWYGRVGFGPFEVVDDRPMIEYDGFYYDFEADSGGFILRQNGASDRAGLDGAHFGPGESDVYAPELSTLDGIWQDALGETLVIDTGRMEYLAYSPDGMTGGTIHDGGDGLGVYLFLNGRGYFAVSPDGNSFTLFFEASDTNAPDGTYEGVFYRNGDADLYAELDDAEFYASDGHLRYYDGENIFFLPDTYAVAADGLAYDGAGNVFAAGWDMPYYDPADDWGDNWANNWTDPYKKKKQRNAFAFRCFLSYHNRYAALFFLCICLVTARTPAPPWAVLALSGPWAPSADTAGGAGRAAAPSGRAGRACRAGTAG